MLDLTKFKFQLQLDWSFNESKSKVSLSLVHAACAWSFSWTHSFASSSKRMRVKCEREERRQSNRIEWNRWKTRANPCSLLIVIMPTNLYQSKRMCVCTNDNNKTMHRFVYWYSRRYAVIAKHAIKVVFSSLSLKKALPRQSMCIQHQPRWNQLVYCSDTYFYPFVRQFFSWKLCECSNWTNKESEPNKRIQMNISTYKLSKIVRKNQFMWCTVPIIKKSFRKNQI